MDFPDYFAEKFILTHVPTRHLLNRQIQELCISLEYLNLVRLQIHQEFDKNLQILSLEIQLILPLACTSKGFILMKRPLYIPQFPSNPYFKNPFLKHMLLATGPPFDNRESPLRGAMRRVPPGTRLQGNTLCWLYYERNTTGQADEGKQAMNMLIMLQREFTSKAIQLIGC